MSRESFRIQIVQATTPMLAAGAHSLKGVPKEWRPNCKGAISGKSLRGMSPREH